MIGIFHFPRRMRNKMKNEMGLPRIILNRKASITLFAKQTFIGSRLSGPLLRPVTMNAGVKFAQYLKFIFATRRSYIVANSFNECEKNKRYAVRVVT